MPDNEILKALCYASTGDLKPRPACRSAIINHLILEEMMDVDEAEDVADKTLNALNLWPMDETDPPATNG